MSEQKNNKTISQKYIPPQYTKPAFHCPHCEVYANQIWYNVCKYDSKSFGIKIRNYLERNRFYTENVLNFIEQLYIVHKIKNSSVSFCAHCYKYSIWVHQEMVYPNLSTAPLPIEEMPEPVKKLYNEARDIAERSPRGACALLRLAIQFLVKELGEDENNLNKAIGNLVIKRGLSSKIQKALDSVRVIGNNAVHPGKIDIEDNPQIKNNLFGLINFISERLIKNEHQIDTIYESLPENTKKVTEKRDKK